MIISPRLQAPDMDDTQRLVGDVWMYEKNTERNLPTKAVVATKKKYIEREIREENVIRL